MNKCVFNTILSSNTLFMVLKLVYVCIYICIYIYFYAHCSSSSMSTLVLLQDLNLTWPALMGSQKAKQLLSADWSYNTYIWFIPRFVIFFFSVLVNEKEGGSSWKKCDTGGRGVQKKCHSALTYSLSYP